MAQGKVTDFFSARKRNPTLQPSKKRKVEIVASEIDVRTLDKTNSNPYRNLAETIENVCDADKTKETPMFSPLQTRASRKAKATTVAPVVKKTTRGRKQRDVDPRQKLISESYLEPAKGLMTVSEAVTASFDDHDGPPVTPSKTTEKKNTRKRSRQDKTTQECFRKQDEATPEKRATEVVKIPVKGRTRKKLQMVIHHVDIKSLK